MFWNCQENSSKAPLCLVDPQTQLGFPPLPGANPLASRSRFLLERGALVPLVMGANVLQHSGAGISLQLTERTTPEQISRLKTLETPHWSSRTFPEGTMAFEELMLEKVCSMGCSPSEGSTLGQEEGVMRKKCQREADTD